MEEFEFSDNDSLVKEAYDEYLQMEDPELDQILQDYGQDLDHLGQEYLHRHPELPRRINPDLPAFNSTAKRPTRDVQPTPPTYLFVRPSNVDNTVENVPSTTAETVLNPPSNVTTTSVLPA